MGMKIKFFLVSILSAFLVSGCSLNNGVRVYDNEKMIAEAFDSYNLVKSKQSMSENYLSGSAEKLEGMGTIWKLNASEETEINLTYRITVSSGKAKLVLICPDDSLTTLAEFTAEPDKEYESTETFQAEKGKNRVKLIGGKGTKIDYEITSDKGNMKSFGS